MIHIRQFYQWSKNLDYKEHPLRASLEVKYQNGTEGEVVTASEMHLFYCLSHYTCGLCLLCYLFVFIFPHYAAREIIHFPSERAVDVFMGLEPTKSSFPDKLIVQVETGRAIALFCYG